MARDILDNRVAYFTKDKADSVRPILKWIKEAASRKRERTQAANILREIHGIQDWKQVQLTRGEAELLSFVQEEFPGGVSIERGRQLSLFSILEKPEGPRPKTISLVEKETKPVLRTDLTAEEQKEREETLRTGSYEPKSSDYWNKKILRAPGEE